MTREKRKKYNSKWWIVESLVFGKLDLTTNAVEDYTGRT